MQEVLEALLIPNPLLPTASLLADPPPLPTLGLWFCCRSSYNSLLQSSSFCPPFSCLFCSLAWFSFLNFSHFLPFGGHFPLVPLKEPGSRRSRRKEIRVWEGRSWGGVFLLRVKWWWHSGQFVPAGLLLTSKSAVDSARQLCVRSLFRAQWRAPYATIAKNCSSANHVAATRAVWTRRAQRRRLDGLQSKCRECGGKEDWSDFERTEPRICWDFHHITSHFRNVWG